MEHDWDSQKVFDLEFLSEGELKVWRSEQQLQDAMMVLPKVQR